MRRLAKALLVLVLIGGVLVALLLLTSKAYRIPSSAMHAPWPSTSGRGIMSCG